MKRLSLVSLCLLLLSISGCASIVSKSERLVIISTQPDEASFVIKNHNNVVVGKGTTPTSITLPTKQGYFRSADYTIAFNKEGYSETLLPLNGSLNGWYWGNIVFGGLIGMLIVDPATGAMWTLPEAVSANLEKKPIPLQTTSSIIPVDASPTVEPQL